MTPPAPAVAVLDHGGSQQVLGRLLLQEATRHGLRLELRSHRELVAEVSLRSGPNAVSVVHPDRTLLWLSGSDPWAPGDSSDGFLATETTAASRSIATLTLSAVLNRPSPTNAAGRFPPSAVSSGRRLATEPDLTAVVRTEQFAGSVDTLGPLDDAPEVFDYAVGRASYGIPSDAAGPFRRRAAVRPGRPVRVRVVADRVITAAPLAPSVAQASLRAANRYGLDLLSLWWLVAADAPPVLARADCWLWDAALGADGEALAEALVQWVLHHQDASSTVEASP